jgi:hypothetical protein
VRQTKVIANIAPNNPQAVYKVFTACIKSKWIYLQRVLSTSADPHDLYRPLYDAMQQHIIPCVTGKEQHWTAQERLMLELPVREGGMALEDPCKSAQLAHAASKDATLIMQRFIIAGNVVSENDIASHNSHMGAVSSKYKTRKRKEEEEEAKRLESREGGLSEQAREALHRARKYKTGAWMTVKPEAADKMQLSKNQWMDMVSLRYNKPLVDAPRYCDFHKTTPYTLHHAATCGGGGNRIARHRGIQNCLQAIAMKALGKSAFFVQREPWVVKPGSVNARGQLVDGLRGDLQLRGVHPLREVSIIDVRVFHPEQPTQQTNQSGGRRQETSKSIEAQLKHHENEKHKKYYEACDSEGMGFVPFVVSTDGALSLEAEKLLKTLADKLSTKWETSPGVVMGWMRARVAMAVARASSACIRGNRTQPYGAEKELEADFDDGAGVKRLMDCGMGLADSDARDTIHSQ